MFEFDENKSKTNKQKHNIDFYEAQKLWDDIKFVEIPVRTSDEPRILVTGKILEKHWSAVITYRS